MAASRISVASESCLDLFVLSEVPITTNNCSEHEALPRWSVALRRTVSFLLGMLLLGCLVQGRLQGQTAYFSGAVTSLGNGFYYTWGVAVDPSGNVYVADSGNNAVKEIPPGCTSSNCAILLGGNFRAPKGVALDASGNIYIADSLNFDVKEMPPGCTSAVFGSGGCSITTLGGDAFSEPFGVAVDKSGNVYVADTGDGVVKEMPPNCTSSNCVTTLGGGSGFPTGVAVDGNGNVYVADTNLDLYEMPPGCTLANFQAQLCYATKLGGGIGAQGVTVDGSGNVYVANTFGSVVNEMPPGCTSASCVTTLGGGFGAPSGIAVDQSGNVYVGIQSNAAVQEIMPHGINFGAVPVGSTGPTLTLYFTFTAGDSGITASVVTQGAMGLDFIDAGTGTCDTNGTSYTYTAYPLQSYYSFNCTVNVTFGPKYAGARYGAVQLSDTTGVIATAYIYGTGQGPQLVFPSNQSVTTLGGGFYYPAGVAVDGSGDVYVADVFHTSVKEVPAGCTSASCVTTRGGGFSQPFGVAVDGGGNVYIADVQKSAVKEMPPGCASASCVITLGGGFVGPEGVAVDGSGNVYVADTGNNAVKQMLPGCSSASCVTTLGGGFSSPYGVAVDGGGNVYVADTDNNAVKEMPPGCASASCVTTLGGGFRYPGAVAVDGIGNVYVADSNNSAVKEIAPGCASANCVTTLGGGFYYPYGVAVDASGNVYVGDDFNSLVKQINISASPSLSFANANVGSQSTDSPQTVTLENIGNEPLTFQVPGTGENPSISTNFSLDLATTCPEVLTSSSAGSLAAGASCLLAVDFIPTASGLISGTAVLTDNNLNASNAAQQIILSGTGISQTTPTIAWGTPAAITYGTPLSSTQLNATASVGGTFVYSPPVGTLLSAGTETLSVTFTPNDTTDYTTASANVMLQVNMAPQTITFAALPATQQGGTLSLSATGGLSGNPLTFTSLTPGVCSVLNTTATLSSPGTCTIQANQLGNSNYAAAIPVSQSVINTAALSFGTIPVGTTSSTQTVTLSPPGGASLASISVVTQGAANLDFSDAGGGTCVPSLARFAAGASCTVNVTFSPKYAGARLGAVVLTDGNGNVLATSYVTGTGQGPQLVFPSSQTVTTLGGGFIGPFGVAVDGSGNVYVADSANSAVKEMPAGCASASCVATLGGGFLPQGVAVDGGGNVYVADFGNSAVKEMPPGCSSSSCVTLLGGGFSYPFGVAVDGSGNVYVADGGNSAVKEMPPGCSSSSCVTLLGGGFATTTGIAVDGGGNVYVSTESNEGGYEYGAVYEMPPGCSSSSCATPLGGGFTGAITGVTVDGAGNVYVADGRENLVYEMPSGCTSYRCVTQLGVFVGSEGVALDGTGNVYVTAGNAVKELNITAPPSLSFASTKVGSESNSSPPTVMLRNIGNAPLSFSVPVAGENPSISTNFALDSATTCPEVMTSSSAGSLAAGATCALAVDFIPTTSGPISGTAVLTDNNLNVSSATQTINLSGTGLNSTVSVSIGTNPIGLSFSINGTAYSSTQTPDLNIGTQYALSTTSPQAGGPGVQYVFSQWSDGTLSLTDQLTPTASSSSDTAQFTAQYTLTVTAGSGGTIAASTAPNAFYNPATVQPIAATPNPGYYFVGWTGANSPSDISSATSASTSVTMNGPENLTANFAPIPTFQVTTLNDDATGIAANCTTPSPNCSLRDAITAVQSINGSTGNITFASGLVGTITLTSALPTLIGQMTITGPGATSLSISGGNSQVVGSVFTLDPGATVALSGVTITGGNSDNGGAVTNNGSLTVSNSTLSGNTGGCGGAICNLIGVAQSASAGNLTLIDSTISGNQANFNGGAIVNSGALIVIDSTISGNSASYVYGGGIYNANGTLTVVNSTISGNVSGQYGGGIFNASVVTISNSIVAGNTASGNPGDDCDRCGTQSNYNLITTPDNIVNPLLASLGNYGGPTQTMLPLPGSGAICAASSSLIPPGTTKDQRGFPNSTTYNNTTCNDLGAVQTNYGFSFTTEPSSTGTLPSLAMLPAPAVTVTESGSALIAGSVSVSVTDANSDLTASPATAATSTSNGQAVFSSLIFTGATSNDTLDATLVLNTSSTLSLTAASTSFGVAPATPTVTWPTASAITYGQTLASSALSGGLATVGTSPVAGSFAFTNPSAVPSAGTQAENVSFTPSNTSAYNSVGGIVTVLVNKATPTVAFTGAPGNAAYGGTFSVVATTNATTSASITASGSCSVSGATVTITKSSGTCLLKATWAADNNYLATSATQSTIATKASPLITWPTPSAITYGTALSATQLNATATNAGNTVAGTFAYTPAKGTILGAGNQTLSVTFTPSNITNFTVASASVVLRVNQATPKITWAKPSAITYGTALSSTQLDATASVPGTLVYSPAAGTVLDAGTQTLSVSFTPADTADYTTATGSVTISVTKATVVITWATPAPIVYGTALSGTQLDATASVPGTFVYSPAAGKIETAGSNKLSVTFTPTDTVDYGTVIASVTLQVNPATPSISWSTPAAITYGSALTTTQLDAAATNGGATVAGTFVYTPAKGTVLAAGSQTLSATFTPSNTTNFTSASASVVLQVNQATPKITWAKPAAITYGTALSSTQLDATGSVPGTLVYSPALGTVLAGGTQTLSVTLNPTDSVDYTTAMDSVSITVNQTTSTTSITSNTPNPSVAGQLVTVSFNVSGDNGVPTGTVKVTASTGQSCSGVLNGGTGSCALTFTAAGSPSLTAVYSGDASFKASTSARVTQTVQP